MHKLISASLTVLAAIGCIAAVSSPAEGSTFYAIPGAVAGTVVDAVTSEPIEGISVRLEPVGRPDRTSSSAWPYGGYTNPLGNYASGDVPPGDYKVFFDTRSNDTVVPGDTEHASSWYPDQQFIEGAEVITVESEQTTVINMELNTAGSIAGTVTNRPTSGSASVTAFAWNSAANRWTAQGTASVNAGGAFKVLGLQGGVEYRLWAQTTKATPDYSELWSIYYNGARSLEEAAGIPVTAGAVASGISITVPAHGTVPTRRIAGSNRYETAALVSAEFETADIVFIANGEKFPDALSAAPVAATLGGPILLTPPDALPSAVISELERLAPSTVVIAGSEASVSAEVEAEIEALLGLEVDRVAGENRYATSRALARYGFPNYVENMYIATGTKFPDALSAGALAGDGKFPVVLVDGSASTADEETKTLIRDLGPRSGYVLGLSDSVSQGLQDSLNSMQVPRTLFNRSGWGNRYYTSLYLSMSYYYQRPADKVYLALGTKFPDALAGAALAGSQGAPLLIIRGECVPFQVKEFIYGLGAREVVLLGGPTGLAPAIDSLKVC